MWFAVYIFYLISGTALSHPNITYNYNCSGVCVGLENSSENTSENVSDYSDQINVQDLLNITGNLSSVFRFATPCETPNFEVALCIEISKCPVLDAVKSKRKYAEFVEASQCGPENADKSDIRVCCGKYNSFRNVSKNIVSVPSVPDDMTVLPKKCGTQKLIMRGRIVGGTEAALGEYPWMARIIHKNIYGQKSYGCAGFLIHAKYVLTAAHCIHSEFSKVRGDPYSVLLGEHNTTTKIDCSPGGTFCADPVQTSRISNIVVHKEYQQSSKNHHHDIALIHLRKAIKLTDFVQPICLQTNNELNVKKYYISGWGKTETSESSPVKLKVDLVPFDKQECQEKFDMLNLEIDNTQICAGGEKLKDSCNGDSGGPLMTFNGTNYFASGLVSYGIGCGMPGWPGIYTSIPAYIDWITAQIIDVSTRSPKIRKNKKNKKKVKAEENVAT
ncbi:phenoloxidase-activating factor 1-like isoform X2 [Anthonomus grandis grandis]|uniref:phenoloxidase-activating factor 1-like isoform X2 n=1 Tax=Anthonomus grandis grandis TaxID=2921223 RepID=UPI002166596B|nr:phenoloxidase-activating factor 1-like isoform X2 [Anthonomus grandis grandis]